MIKKTKNPYIIKRSFNFFNESISPEDIDIQVNETKETLNKEIWENGKLKKEVRIAMLKIAKAFKEYLKLDAPIKDVIFTGSLANYNWTLSSDVDIHLILDLPSLNEPEEFVQEYIVAKKTIWNDEHDIKIKNFEVELFAKDEETILSSKGIYSIIKDAWIQKPKKYTADIDEISIKEKAATIMNDIDELQQIVDDEDVVKKAEKIIEKIKKLRNSGLEKGGEFSIENLAFKVIRKAGYLEKLYKIKDNSFDSSLTLTEKNLTETFKRRKKLIKEIKETKIESKQENILGVEHGIKGMTPEKIELIRKFINFTANRLELEEPVSIYLHKGRDEYIMTTASYVPDENSNHVRCTGRALVDILRSIAHELTHNRQREIESFQIGENVPTIGGWIEDEANAKAGILIKDFAMNFGFDEIYDL